MQDGVPGHEDDEGSATPVPAPWEGEDLRLQHIQIDLQQSCGAGVTGERWIEETGMALCCSIDIPSPRAGWMVQRGI